MTQPQHGTMDVEDVQREMLDANEALKDDEIQAAHAKLQEAERRCGILLRQRGGNDE